MDGAYARADRLPLLLRGVETIVVPVGAGVAVGTLFGPAWLAAVAAAAALAGFYLWRNYVIPSRPPPRDVRPPRK